MYYQSTRRTTARPQLKVSFRGLEIPPDPRAAYVAHFCRVLSESRVGPGFAHEPWSDVIGLGDNNEVESAFVDDLCASEFVPFHAQFLQGRACGRKVDAAIRRSLQMERLAIETGAGSPSSGWDANQGRGSPDTQGRKGFFLCRRMAANFPQIAA